VNQTEINAAAETAKGLILEAGMSRLEALTLLIGQRLAGKMLASGCYISERDMADIVKTARHHAEGVIGAAA
jgi:hypothetical protein